MIAAAHTLSCMEVNYDAGRSRDVNACTRARRAPWERHLHSLLPPKAALGQGFKCARQKRAHDHTIHAHGMCMCMYGIFVHVGKTS